MVSRRVAYSTKEMVQKMNQGAIVLPLANPGAGNLASGGSRGWRKRSGYRQNGFPLIRLIMF